MSDADKHDRKFWEALEEDIASTADLHPELGVPNTRVHMLDVDQIKQRIVWDMVPCEMATEVLDRLGIHPTSDDVADREHEDSHERINAVALVYPLLASFSSIAAEAAIQAVAVAHEVEVSADDIEDRVRELGQVILMSNIAAIAELLDLGLVHYPHGMIVDEEQDTGEAGS